MTQQEKALYEFGPYRLVPAERLLLREGEAVPLTPKAFETLVALVRRSGRLVEKNDLLTEVWPGTSVEESNVAQNVFALRRALTRNADDPEYIETVPKRGYRFAVPVTVIHDDGGELRRRAEPRTDTLADANPLPVIEARVASPALRGIRVLLMIAGAIAVAGASVLIARRSVPVAEPSRTPAVISLSRLIAGHRIPSAAISPDGRYVAHVVEQGTESTIVIRQISTVTDLPVLPTAQKVYYWGLTFSPDGDSLYYIQGSAADQATSLYRVSVLGGTPRKIATAVDSVVGLSHDGRQLAFIRDSTGPESLLIVASADGTGERVLARRRKPASFFSSSPRGGPSWSPDGSTIATGIISLEGGYHGDVVTVSVSDGMQKPLTSHRWHQVARTVWLPDGSGLLITARESGVAQIWSVSYPGGEAHRVTTDLSDYHDLSLTADSSALVTVQYDRRSTLEFVPDQPSSASKRSTAGMDEGFYGLSWTPSGELAYASDAAGNHDLWLLSADGTQPRQLTTDPEHDSTPSVSPDGRTIAFLSRRGDGNPHVWRMNVDGSEQRQLTHQTSQATPLFTPDGRWILYAEASLGIWKVPAEGGTPILVARGNVHTPSVSPDGTLLACFSDSLDPRVMDKLAIFSMNDSERPVRLLDYPEGFSAATVRWTPDGRALIYVSTRDGVGNLRTLPLDGGAPRDLTHFTTDRLFNFAFSHDRRQLAVARGPITEHVVLIRDFR